MEIGLVDRVTDALATAEVEWSVYADVEPDPTFDQVEAGHDRYVADGCDTVVAVGGGSPMDAAR